MTLSCPHTLILFGLLLLLILLISGIHPYDRATSVALTLVIC